MTARKRERTTRLLRIAVPRPRGPLGPSVISDHISKGPRLPLRPFLLRLSVSAWYLLFAAKQLGRLRRNALLSPIYLLSFNFHSDQRYVLALNAYYFTLL